MKFNDFDSHSVWDISAGHGIQMVQWRALQRRQRSQGTQHKGLTVLWPPGLKRAVGGGGLQVMLPILNLEPQQSLRKLSSDLASPRTWGPGAGWGELRTVRERRWTGLAWKPGRVKLHETAPETTAQGVLFLCYYSLPVHREADESNTLMKERMWWKWWNIPEFSSLPPAVDSCFYSEMLLDGGTSQRHLPLFLSFRQLWPLAS